MEATPSFHLDILPQSPSSRVIEEHSPDRASIDGGHGQDGDEAVPGAVANIGTDQATGDRRQSKRYSGTKGLSGLRYSGSSDTIGNEELIDYLIAHKDTPVEPLGSSSVGDVRSQHLGTQHTEPADVTSSYSTPFPSRDVEKGEAGSKEHNQVSRDGEGQRQSQWENNVVGWDGPNDPQNPQNWNKSKKYTVTAIYSSVTFCTTFASSIFSTATMVTAKEYGVSSEVMTLGTSLFVFVGAHAQHHPYQSLTKITGIRRRPHNMGPPLRTVRSEVSSLRWIRHFRRLSSSHRGSPKR